MKSQRKTFSSLLCLFLFTFMMAASKSYTLAAEPSQAWTSTGSVGSPGEVTRKCVNTANPFLIILNCSSSAPPPVELQGAAIGLADVPAYSGPVAAPLPDYHYEDKVTIRYNVTAVEGLSAGSAGNAIRMLVKYLDTGEHAQITVKLIEYNLVTGAATTRLNFDSKQYLDSNSYQVRYVADTRTDFDFSSNAYYIETTMKLAQPVISGLGGSLTAPKLAAVQLEKTFLINFPPLDISIPRN